MHSKCSIVSSVCWFEIIERVGIGMEGCHQTHEKVREYSTQKLVTYLDYLFRAQKSQQMTKLNLKTITLLCFIFYYLIPFFSLNSFIDAILFSIPWATLITLISHFFISDLLWHSWYLSLTCYYFKLKLSYLHRLINECK